MLNILKSDQESEDSSERKRSNSQRKYQKAPDIITQAKPNSFVQPINPHKSAFTPSNRSKKFYSEKLLLPPKSQEFSNKKTLILDLDETLVHSSFTPFEKSDIVLDVNFEGIMYNIYVLVRPDAELFIKSVAKFFEVVIFTASISKYASQLLDILDKEKNIKYRLYRDHCTYINGIYIKELKKCNRSLKDLIIVDNSPIAYTFDSDNGLPIETWTDDPDDRELMKLLPILEFLSKVKDVRVFTKIFVNNNKILYKDAMEIIKKEDLIDKKFFNVKSSDNKDNNTCNEYMPNIKVLPKENFEDSPLKEVKIIKKEEANVNINVNVNINNVKNNNDNTIIDINNRNDEIKLNLINKDNNTSNNTQNTFMEEGFNTTKNSKLNNNIYFNNKINSKEISTNSNYTNNDKNSSIKNNNNNKQNNQKQSKKNIFRFKQPNKIGINNIIFSNKYDPSIPLTLISSNITKELLTPKASSQDKNINNKGNFKNKKNKDKTNNIKSFLSNDIQNDKNIMNKNIKYINLLDKFKENNKVTNSLINKVSKVSNNNPKQMKNNYSMKNISLNKPYNLRVSSSISSYHGYTPGNSNNMVKEKNGTSYYRVTKSKSTENLYLNNTNKYPKTPKEQYNNRKKNKNIINFLEGINYTKAENSKNKNNIKSKTNYGGMYKGKQNKVLKNIKFIFIILIIIYWV